VVISVVFFGIPSSDGNISRMNVIALESLRGRGNEAISRHAMNIDVHIFVWSPEGTPPQCEANGFARADGPLFNRVAYQPHLTLEICAHREVGSWRLIQGHASHGPEMVREMKAEDDQEHEACASGAPVSKHLRVRGAEVHNRSGSLFLFALPGSSQDSPREPS